MKSLNPLAQRFYQHLSYGNLGTANTYTLFVDGFLKFIGKPHDKVLPMDFTEWFAHLEKERNYKRRTVKVGAHALKRFYDSMGLYAIKGMIPVPSVGEISEPKWLAENLCFRLIGKVPILCVAYDLALRIGEVPLLKTETLNLKTGEIEVTRLKHNLEDSTNET
jgi:integrase